MSVQPSPPVVSPAEVRAGVDEDGGLAEAGDLDGGGDAGGCRAVDDDIGPPGLCGAEQGEQEERRSASLAFSHCARKCAGFRRARGR